MIYILEDDESIRKLVIYALETQGFEAAGFENAERFWKAFSEKKPELVLLDIMLPGEDGLSVLKKIRKEDGKISVIMLTAKSTEYDKVTGLDMGADDYVSKPFGIMELISRIKAEDFVGGSVGLPTVQDILKELAKPGLDPREQASEFAFADDVHSLEDLRTGMELPGIVTNITAFGAFVDVGLHVSNNNIHITSQKINSIIIWIFIIIFFT